MASFPVARTPSLERPMVPYEAIQLFSSLGHLDVEWDMAGTLPLRWDVSPSAVVVTEHEDAFLAGYRSGRMLAALGPLGRTPRGEMDH